MRNIECCVHINRHWWGITMYILKRVIDSKPQCCDHGYAMLRVC